MTRVLIVTNILSPYRVPLLNALAMQGDLEVEVVLLAGSEANREWSDASQSLRFHTQVLPGMHWFVPARELHVHLNWGLSRAIRNLNPDVLLTSGYEHLAFWQALYYAKLHRKPFVLWSEPWLGSAEHRGGVIAAAKRFFVRRVDAQVAFGTKAREYLKVLGAKEARVFTGINTVDMEWYRGEYLASRRDSSFEAKRSKYPPIMLLYVGQLIERKNVRSLLEALLLLRDRDIGMFVVGSGPQQEALQELCRRSNVETVYFEGFKQQSELPWYYAMSDVLVLPSVREVWGLVVNEALATGLYVLCSDRAAVAYDLIEEEWNGRVFDPSGVDRLAELIKETKGKIGEIRARREAISEAACREFSIDRSARALAEAIRTAAGTEPQAETSGWVTGPERGGRKGKGRGRRAVGDLGEGNGGGDFKARASRTAEAKATRVLIVTNILSPYRVPLLNVLVDRTELELAVILLAEREANREWKDGGRAARFDFRVLPGIHWLAPAREVNVHLNWGLGSAIKRFKPDVLLTSGYNNPSYWMTLFHAKKLRKPFVLWFNSWLDSAEHNRGAVVAVKRFFVRHADAHVAFGGKARECLEVLGAYPGRIFTGLNTVDMDWYREEYCNAGENRSLKSERSKYPPVMFLYAGQLIERKNIRGLLEAFAYLRDPEIGLFIVGSGPQREELETLCRHQQVENVYFAGFKQQADMPRYYAMADVLILPSSREVWGLVVNEALATGLYVLCSNRAAAGYDLITDGWNGRLFDPHGANQLAELICETKHNIAEIRARRGAISESACREFGIERLAEAFAAAIRTVTVTERLGRRGVFR